MIAILLETLPFFAVIALGYLAAKAGRFPPEATAWLTRFVFFFALSAMLFRFSASLSLGEVFDLRFAAAYVLASAVLYGVVMAVALVRRVPLAEAAMEAQCGVIGNTGFLGIPLFAALLGERAVAPMLLVLTCDLAVFGALIVILIAGSREGRVSVAALRRVALGLVANPMLVSMAAGFAWAAAGLPLVGPLDDFLVLLGAAATPGALFAIGASLASKSAERLSVAVWLSLSKLILHPIAVGVSALLIFAVEPFAAGVMIAAAALPVAGNVYMLAEHYGVAPQRVSAAILISTAASILTVTAAIALLQPLVAAAGGAG